MIKRIYKGIKSDFDLVFDFVMENLPINVDQINKITVVCSVNIKGTWKGYTYYPPKSEVKIWLSGRKRFWQTHNQILVSALAHELTHIVEGEVVKHTKVPDENAKRLLKKWKWIQFCRWLR